MQENGKQSRKEVGAEALLLALLDEDVFNQRGNGRTVLVLPYVC
jgi:hypothetical protein